MKYKASRISDGNKLFPASIETQKNGINVRLPSFWKNEEAFLFYNDISGVKVDSPLIGFSTIEFSAKGLKVKAHGFSKDDANAIRVAIERGKKENKKA